MIKFEIRKSASATQTYYYVLIGGNGEIMMVSEMITTKQNCQNSIDSIKKTVGYLTPVIDTTL